MTLLHYSTVKFFCHITSEFSHCRSHFFWMSYYTYGFTEVTTCMCRKFPFHTISFLKAINWEQFLLNKGTIHWHFRFIKEIKRVVQLNKYLGYSYKRNSVSATKTQGHFTSSIKYMDYEKHEFGSLRHSSNFILYHLVRKCWLVLQEQIRNVKTTLLACFPHKPLPVPAKPVPGCITQQPAELPEDRTMGFTSTSPATSTQLINTTVGQSPCMKSL